MAEKKFYVGIDLQKNELQQAVIHKLAAAPGSPAQGQIYFNTTDSTLYCWDGTEWVSVVHHDLSVAAGSTDYLDITNHEISLKALGISSVTVNAAVSLAAFVAAEYTVGDEFQEGDIVILTGASDGQKTYIHNGGGAGTEADFTSMFDELTAAEVRGYLSGGDGVTYTSGTGEIAADVDDVTVQVGASGIEIKDEGVTQAKLASALEAKIVTGYAETVGDGVATSFTITHNLGTNDIMTAMYEVDTGECVACQVTRDSVNQITVGAFPAPTTNNLRVLVQKLVTA